MKKVLVIENIGIVRKKLCINLTKKKYYVLQAKQGQVGLEIAKAEIPDLIVSNVNLKDLNAFKLMYELQKEIVTVSIPIIFFNSLEYKEYLSDKKHLYPKNKTNKSFNENELFQKIEITLRGY